MAIIDLTPDNPKEGIHYVYEKWLQSKFDLLVGNWDLLTIKEQSVLADCYKPIKPPFALWRWLIIRSAFVRFKIPFSVIAWERYKSVNH